MRMTKEEKINKVKELRSLLILVQNDKSTEKTREKIYQLVPIVSPIMVDLGTLQTMTVGKYGAPDRIVNPIENIFLVPYGMTYEVRNALIDMLNKTIGVLQSKEEISKSVKDNIWSIMHPEIIRVAKKRFDAELYADAVEAAFKEINLQVKSKCKDRRHQNKDGKGLMMMAFSANNPVLKFAPSSSFSEYDIQEGYMHMFAGAMQGIRNPKAHANEMITNEDALRKLAFASMLMYKLDTVVE